MNNQPIGILDSGVGGLSIWREIVIRLPNESTIYLADSLNCPYGDKTPEEVYFLAKKMVEVLLRAKAKVIVLACNTITVSCLDKLRRDFPDIPIVGTVPVVKTAAEVTKNKKIGILSTVTTAKSDYQKQLIEKFADGCTVISRGTNNLVPFVEKGEVEGEKLKIILREDLKDFLDQKVDVIALGCSHFPFLKKAIKEVMGEKVKVLDSSGAISRQVERVLTNNQVLSSQKIPTYTFYTTSNVLQFSKVAQELMGNELADKIQKIEQTIL